MQTGARANLNSIQVLFLCHALAHIEFNAINLALDAAYRFNNMPHEYYTDWLKVAAEEAYHFTLLESYLHKRNAKYGDFNTETLMHTMVYGKWHK